LLHRHGRPGHDVHAAHIAQRALEGGTACQLQQAFQNVYQAMDTIADFKLKALDSMQTTVNTLTSEVDKSRAYLERARGTAEAASASTEVRL